MLRFTLVLRPRDGHFFPERRDSPYRHPAVECAIELLKRAQFDPTSDGKYTSLVELELINLRAPDPQVMSWRKIRALTEKGLLRRKEAKEASGKEAVAALYAAAQAENIRAGQEATRLTEVIYENQRTIQDWRVHYAELGRAAIFAFERADEDKRRQMANLPLREQFVDCSRDLQDAGRLARKAKHVLQGHDLGVFFSQKAADYAKHQDLPALCSAEADKYGR